MKNTYVDAEHRATVSLLGPLEKADRYTGAYIITGWEINHKFRGKGHAKKLFDTVMNEADAEGATLMLEVDPDGTGLDYIALFAFYESRGFQRIDESNFAMVREPNASQSNRQL